MKEIKEYKKELQFLGVENETMERSIKYNKKRIKTLEKKIEELNVKKKVLDKGVDVSDHTVVQFMKRFCDVPVDDIKNNISERIKDIYMGDGRYMVDNHTYIVKGGIVVTMYEGK